ncbi:MAG: cytochrome c [Silvibacterium sp.]|nr:cytochrome c [Silvibacterium sp.]MBV8436483.1 cytochrome c [Silvibacterium sp.]
MKPLWVAGLLAVASALAIGLSKREIGPGQEQAGNAQQLPLHAKRMSATDLEFSGDVPGSQAYDGMYASYGELLGLRQATFTVTDDPNFPVKAELGGVTLDELMQTLHIPDKKTLVAAVCDDGYEAHYSADYRAAHDPLLVLTINGKAPTLVKRSGEEGAYGPYLISHPRFIARYRILSHTEETQIPNGVIELRFLNEDEVLDAIHPRGNFAADAPQIQGYEIAKENCLRCHNAGAYGGLKAGITWSVLGKIARRRPKYFRAYIKDPQAESDYAEMPGFPEYDDATLAALTEYFQTVNTGSGQK